VPPARGDADLALERRGERAVRPVADAGRDGRDGGTRLEQQAAGAGHPEREDVAHRRVADPVGEAGGERRAREPGGAGELTKRPRVGEVGVDRLERGGDAGVAQPGEPAGVAGG